MGAVCDSVNLFMLYTSTNDSRRKPVIKKIKVLLGTCSHNTYTLAQPTPALSTLFLKKVTFLNSAIEHTESQYSFCSSHANTSKFHVLKANYRHLQISCICWKPESGSSVMMGYIPLFAGALCTGLKTPKL